MSPSATLLRWYDRSRRDLPWRAKPGETPDPYRVWLSEIMLQQTTVAAVIPYFQAFVQRWPNVFALAAARDEEVMSAWAGLGYYARARNLLACARAVAAAGRFPDTEDGLRALPGVGAYTAAAVAAIAFDRRAVVVDGNVERVVTRLFGIGEPLPAARPLVRDKTDSLTPARRAGDFAQAMMDLGATICTPRSPACILCPLAEDCVARRSGDQASFPRKQAKKGRPTRSGTVYVAIRIDGAALLRTRPPQGLLGGMAEFPSAWSDASVEAEDAPFAAAWRTMEAVEHGFTHFDLTLEIRVAEGLPLDLAAPENCRWTKASDLPKEALPTLMLKVARAAGLDVSGGGRGLGSPAAEVRPSRKPRRPPQPVPQA